MHLIRKIMTTIALTLRIVCAASTEDAALADLLAGAGSLRQQGRYQDAYQIAVQARRAAERLDPSDSRHAVALDEIGLVCQFLGRYAEAEGAYRRAIRIVESDPVQGLLLTRVLHNLGSLYMEHDARYPQAERVMRRALELGTPLMGSQAPDIGAMLGNLALAHSMQRHDSEARMLFSRALAILEKSPAAYQVNTASVLSNLGFLCFRQGDFSGALPYLLRAVALFEQTLGPNHPELLKPLINLGRIYLNLNRAASAEEPFRRAAAIAGTLGHDHPLLVEVLSSLALVLRKNGKKKESREMEVRARALHAGLRGDTDKLIVHISDLVISRRVKTQK